MSAHAVYSPSSAHRWIPCPGSPLGVHTGNTFFSAEGTAAHDIAARCLSEGLEAAQFVGSTFRVTDTECFRIALDIGPPPAGAFNIDVDADMAASIQVYVDAITRRAGAKEIEIRVDLANVLGVEGQFGTADAIVFADDALEVHDLKFGRGHRVSAERNEQMMLYAAGALEMYGMIQAWTKVRMFIHQPRLDHVSEWECTVEELAEFVVIARHSVEMSQLKGADVALRNPGDKQCQWCPAKATCPALQKLVAETCFDVLTDEVKEVPLFDDVELGKARALVNLVEGWAAAVVKATEESLLAGRKIPGWKVVHGRKGNRAWSSAEEAEAALKRFKLKQDEMYESKLIGPAKAEKVVSPIQWKKLAALITQPDGKPQVVPESDSREAISRADEFETLI